MSDTQDLLRRFQLLLALPFVASACDSAADLPSASEDGGAKTAQLQPVEASDPVAQPVEVAEPSTGVVQAGETTGAGESGQAETSGQADVPLADPKLVAKPQKQFNRPTCPRVTWCGSHDIAAQYKLGATSSGVCAKEVKLPGGFSWTEQARGRERTLASSRTADLDTERTKHAQADDPKTCCYTWTTPCPGGRPYADHDTVLVAELIETHNWCGPLTAHATPAPLDAMLADAWARDAAMEHASVASFARAGQELLALGAPPSLLRACQRAIQDELRHAQACYALASRFAGRPLGPGPLPMSSPRAADFAQLATDTFREGCLGETVAALSAQRAANHCKDPQARATLIQIAQDEARHAELAWQTLAWALTQAPAEVRAALLVCARDSAYTPDRKPATATAIDQRGQDFGRLTPTLLAQAHADAITQIIEPMLASLLGHGPHPSARIPSA